MRRGQSPSKASVTGSSRFESAASSRWDLGEGAEEEEAPSVAREKGKEREREEWRHASYPNPLAANTANAGETSERVGASRSTRTAAGEEKMLRLSQFFAPPAESAAEDPVLGNFRRRLERAWEGEGDDVGGGGGGGGESGVFGDGDGEGRARFVGNENQGKRPTSVEVSAGGQMRNKSLRGNLGTVGSAGDVVHVGREGAEGAEGTEGDERGENNEGNEMKKVKKVSQAFV